MRRASTRNRLLTTTAALSVVLASMTPVPLPAQETAPAQTVPVPPAAPEAQAPAEEAAPEAREAVPEVEAPTPSAPEAEAAEPDTGMTAPATPEEENTEPAAPEAGRAAPPAGDAEEAAPGTEAPARAAPQAADPDNGAATPSAPEAAPGAAPGAEQPVTPRTEAPATEAPTTEAPATESPAPEAPATGEATPAPGSTTEAPAAEAPAAEAPATTTAEPVPAPETTEPPAEAVDTLNTLLGGGGAEAPAAAAAAAAAAGATDAPSDNATVTEVTDEDARSSGEDFTTTASGERRSDNDDDDDDGGLSTLQKVGLLALGGLAVGALMNNGDEVVSNTGDRVVLRQNDGQYQVLKDDDALLRQPGSTVRTESYADGSTRSFVAQGDGSQVVTIRDASGRVLRRSRIDANGTETLLIDDTRQVAPVDTSLLPRTREDIRVSATDRASLRDALARIEARDNARGYSLAQIRDYRQVRALAPVVDVDNITFRTGSAAVEASQAEQLSDLGTLLRDLIAERPGEVFLIEGHTDAVGSDAANLALSDRRAESVALALTEYFDVPPENMVVQGYGESDLRVESEGDEPRNRRVAVRIITPILQVAQAR